MTLLQLDAIAQYERKVRDQSRVNRDRAAPSGSRQCEDIRIASLISSTRIPASMSDSSRMRSITSTRRSPASTMPLRASPRLLDIGRALGEPRSAAFP